MLLRRRFQDLPYVQVVTNPTATSFTFSITMYNNYPNVYYVDWGDGTQEADEITPKTHTFSKAGTYTITVYGHIRGIDFVNQDLYSADFTHQPALFITLCYNNKLQHIDVSNNPVLYYFRCYSNQLTELDVTHCPALVNFRCYSNQLTELDVTQCPALVDFLCFSNQLTELDVTQCPALVNLICYSNQLTELDVTHCPALVDFRCYLNQLTELDVTQCPALTTLSCFSNQLTELDVTQCPALTTLSCYSNQLTELDVTQCPALVDFRCYSNQLTELDVTQCPALVDFRCYSNQLTELDVTQCPALVDFRCYSNQLTELDVTQCPALVTLNCHTQTTDFNILGFTNGESRTYKLFYNLSNSSVVPSQDLDLTGLTPADGNSHFNLATTGSVKLNVPFNTTYDYKTRFPNDVLNSFIAQASYYELHFEGYTDPIIVDTNAEDGGLQGKIDFYERVAEVIRTKNLHDYPQMNKVVLPKITGNNCRLLYNAAKTIIRDSGLLNQWRTNMGAWGDKLFYNFVDFSSQYQTGVNTVVNGVNKFKIVFKPDAEFFVAPYYTGYLPFDNRDRFYYESNKSDVINKSENTSYSEITNLDGNKEVTLNLNILRADGIGLWESAYHMDSRLRVGDVYCNINSDDLPLEGSLADVDSTILTKPPFWISTEFTISQGFSNYGKTFEELKVPINPKDDKLPTVLSTRCLFVIDDQASIPANLVSNLSYTVLYFDENGKFVYQQTASNSGNVINKNYAYYALNFTKIDTSKPGNMGVILPSDLAGKFNSHVTPANLNKAWYLDQTGDVYSWKESVYAGRFKFVYDSAIKNTFGADTRSIILYTGTLEDLQKTGYVADTVYVSDINNIPTATFKYTTTTRIKPSAIEVAADFSNSFSPVYLAGIRQMITSMLESTPKFPDTTTRIYFGDSNPHFDKELHALEGDRFEKKIISFTKIS